MSEPWEFTATEGLKAISGGTLSCEGWVASCFERIELRDDTVLAWKYLDRKGALAAARNIDKAGSGGLAGGLPFGVKDIIDTADMPTAYGSSIHHGHLPGRDAGCVAITRAAGGVLLGKTVSTEFGHRFPGETRNPNNPDHTPGGSSSGSAAAVGDFMVPCSYGTQTTGSVIRPAAYCGAIGYKPTYGDINTNGVMPNTPSIDTIGAITRSVEDLALVRSILLEEAIQELKPPPLSDLNIGFYRSPFWNDADKKMQELITNCVECFASAGATVTDVELPNVSRNFEELHATVSGYEFSRTLSWERFNCSDKLSAPLRDGRMREGLETSYERYRECWRRLERQRIETDEFFEGLDVLVTPSATGEAPKGLMTTGNAIFNSTWTALGTPAITLPLFVGPLGLPMGLQLVAGRFKDRKLFDIAQAVMLAHDKGKLLC
ncbi:MAG: hypothetical protein CMM57_07770 [Rhodospirillaceae bacterium]|nr:hypothetical protein [Rhodospirillaceae bacterium]